MTAVINIEHRYSLAVEKYKQKKYTDTISYCKKLLVSNRSPLIYHILGLSFYRIGNYIEAIHFINESIKLDANNYRYLQDLGDIYRENKDYQNSIEKYLNVIQLDPLNHKAFFSTAYTLHLMRKFQPALKMGLAALALDKKNIEYQLFNAKCLEEMHVFNEAITTYNEILKFNTNHKKTLLAKSDLLRRMFKYNEAYELAKSCLNLDNNDINCYLLISTILRDMKEINKAIVYLDMGLKIKPDSHLAKFNKGVMLLGLGNFKEGWILYESRWKIKEYSHLPKFTKKPLWNGQKTANLLIWPEQGIGDEIMFSSIFNEVKNDVNNLIIKADQRLIPIFKRSFPKINFISSSTEISDDKYSHHIPMGSLAKFYRKNRNDFNNKNLNFIKTDSNLDSYFKQFFDKKETKKYIGISWKSVNPLSGLKRSATLDDLIKYIGMNDVIYVNLQYGDVDKEILEAEKNNNIKILNIKEVNNKNDLDKLFSIIQNCDEVISIDNSTIHFAGSIGKKTKVLLHESADFRWEINSEESSWYKSAKLIRNIIL